MVPCPQMCPLPNRRTPNKNCKILSLYLRPWTLVANESTVEVPFVTNLAKTHEQLTGQTPYTEATDEEEHVRNLQNAWRSYMANVLPHAQRQIQNFVLACIAEGKNFEDESDSHAVQKRTQILCSLTSEDVDTILNAYERKANKEQNLPDDKKRFNHTARYAQQA